MTDYKLDLAFKGNRNYVQGTTMLDEAVRLLSCAGWTTLMDVEFFIHEMANTNLRLVIEPRQDGALVGNDISVMRFVAHCQPMQARLQRDAGVPSVRVPYDESAVTNRCQTDDVARNIRLVKDDSGFSQIEVLVSMNKALHLEVLDKPVDTSWVFCRWDSPTLPLPTDLSGVTITLKQTLGTRLTRADVELDGKMLGRIYFSAKAAS